MSLRVFAGMLIGLVLLYGCSADDSGTSGNVTPATSGGQSAAGAVAYATSNSIVLQGVPSSSAMAGMAYSYQPTLVSGGDVVFSIKGQPTWLNFNKSTGALEGTPQNRDVGITANMSITATNVSSAASVGPFALRVIAAQATSLASDGSVVISGTPLASVVVGATYKFIPNVTNITGAALTFSIQNAPSWASFNIANGELGGAPPPASVGTDANIVITVSDGRAAVSLAPFTIAVTPVGGSRATVTWVSPTENTDGTALTDLAGYRISYGTSAESLSQAQQVANPGVNSFVVTDLTSGTWYFCVVAYTSSGATSIPSDITTATVL